MRFNYAAYRDEKIISLHKSHKAASRVVRVQGQILDALPEDYPDYTDKQGISFQVFLAPKKTGHHFISLCGFLEPIY